MSGEVQLAVASGSEDLIPALMERMREIRPQLPLYVLSEFRVEGAHWIPYHVGRTLDQNLALCRSVLAGRRVRLVGLILQPRMPYWTMRLLAWKLGGLNTVFFNENLDHFMLRPRSAGTILRHFLWRGRNLVRWELRPGGATYTFFWRLRHPKAFARPWRVWKAQLAGRWAARRRRPRRGVAAAPPGRELPAGISVVIPSRDGRELLERLLPGLIREIGPQSHEIIVVDNGSGDGTREWLAREYPGVLVHWHAKPLSFARAVNAGIRNARYSHLMMLNNDMVIEPGFFPALLHAFHAVPGLFCATAQIFFPPGQRREETGKAVMPGQVEPNQFPVACLEPVPGEDLTPVLYGSGGCSLFDTRKLRALNGLREIYEPAYVEDLDLGWRGWQQGWPSVFVAGARLEHRHRSTSSRFYSRQELDRVLELNYLRFLAHTVAQPEVFSRLWRRAVARLNRRAAAMEPDAASVAALRAAAAIAFNGNSSGTCWEEEKILAAGSGDIAVFPGRLRKGRRVVLIASPYIPFPLSHGGAVRMYNLMKQGARDFDQVLVCFTGSLATPPIEVLELCAEVVLVRREGSHRRPLTDRPDTVEEFDAAAFHVALELTARKWRPGVVQLEFTQMAVYAGGCAGCRTILVEHDVTFDLYRQLLSKSEDWETAQQQCRWERFERAAWERVDAIAVMSEKDRAAVGLPKAVAIPNGVDLERFTPSQTPPEPGRILFIGSFAHLPNILAVDYFLREVWPRIRQRREAVFHIIAGARHRYFLDHYAHSVQPALNQPGIEIEDFAADPRPAYRRAEIVVAPLLASAGTNIKIMEAMAMGKAIVSTPGGVNGLDELRRGADVLVETDPVRMAEEIVRLMSDAEGRRTIEATARRRAEELYGWEAIGGLQRRLYESLLATTA